MQDAIDKNMGRRVLKSVEVFKGLSPHALNLLLDAFQERVFKRGETIFKQGDDGNSFFVVNQGKLKCIVNGKDAKRFKSGEYFGESALLDGKPRNATIVVDPTQIKTVAAFLN